MWQIHFESGDRFAGRFGLRWGENPIVSASIPSYCRAMEENEITHLEGLEDHLVLTQTSDFCQKIGGASGQATGEHDLSAVKKRKLKSNPGKLEKRRGKAQLPECAERKRIGTGG